jgi:YbbR domain-containing protein
MSRVVAFLFRNWPLKLAALVLATMLYAGLVLSQSVQELAGGVTIDPVNIPEDASLIANLPQVSQIRYVSAGDAGARASADSFQASVDLADVDPEAGPSYVPIDVESVDPRFVVVGWEPQGITIQLDPLQTREDIPVVVSQGAAPDGLEVRPALVTPDTVAIRGPASVIERVVEVRADIVIEPNGLDIDREVELIPVDAVGDRVTPVDVEPATAHIRIEIFSDLQTRPLPITPVLGGDPAPGYEIADIDVEPLIASVEGDADQLIGMARVDTAPVQISGATATVTATVPLALPDGVLAIPGSETATVTVTIRPIAATRAYEAGIELEGQRGGLVYDLSTINARATLGGSLGDLEALDAAAFVLNANVAGLGPGTHDVTLTADLPAGLSLVTVDPAVITVTIRAVAASPGASPGASP